MATSLADHYQLLGSNRLSNKGALLIPSQLAFDELLVLEKHLAPREITYLVEATAVLDPPLQRYLDKEDIRTFSFHEQQNLPIDLQKQLQPEITADRLIIFVPGTARACPNPNTTVPSATQLGDPVSKATFQIQGHSSLSLKASNVRRLH